MADDLKTHHSRPELVDALAFALRFRRLKRVHNGDEIMAQIVAERLAEHLDSSGSGS